MKMMMRKVDGERERVLIYYFNTSHRPVVVDSQSPENLRRLPPSFYCT